jgi:hypothetical protein
MKIRASSVSAKNVVARSILAVAVGAAVASVFSINDDVITGNGREVNLHYGDTRLNFQDVNGTQPPAVPGDPIALTLDTSMGLRPTGDALGPEEVTNGTFDDGLTGWEETLATPTNTATLESGAIRLVRAEGEGESVVRSANPVTLIAGETYRVTFEQLAVQNNRNFALYHGDQNLLQGDNDLGVKTAFVTAEGGESIIDLRMRGPTPSVGTTHESLIDNISIRRVVPISERFEGLGDDVWNHADVTTTGDAEIISTNTYRLYSSDGSLSAIAEPNTPGSTGSFYLIRFSVDSIATLGGGVRIGNSGPTVTEVGTYELVTVKEGDFSVFFKRVSGVTDIQITVHFARQLPGNHDSQGTETARKWLGRYPRFGRRNLLSNTTNLNTTTAGWGPIGGIVAADIGPWEYGRRIELSGGTASWHRLAADGANENFVVEPGEKISLGVIYEAGTSGRITLIARDTENGNQCSITGPVGNVTTDSVAAGSISNVVNEDLGGGRYYAAFTLTKGAATTNLRPDVGPASTVGDSVVVLAIQFERSDAPTPVQHVFANYDITEPGVDDIWAGWHDGDDDLSQTAPIDLSGSSTITLAVSGYLPEKPDTIDTVLVSHGDAPRSWISVNDEAGALYGVSQGTVSDFVNAGPGTALVPFAAVNRADISAPSQNLIYRGAVDVEMNSTDTLGTGTFVEAPLAVGGRVGGLAVSKAFIKRVVLLDRDVGAEAAASLAAELKAETGVAP